MNLTLNLIIIAILYIVLAALTATVIRAGFSRFNEDWKKLPLVYRISDVTAELSVLVVSSFWVTYFVHFLVPVLPVDQKLEHFIEMYGGRMVFVYAVFLFVHDLDVKLHSIYTGLIDDGDDRPSQAVRKTS